MFQMANIIKNQKNKKKSNHFFNGPNKRPQSKLGSLLVTLMQILKDAVHPIVVNHGDDGVVQRRPGMGAQMGFTRHTAVTLDLVPLGITLDAMDVQYLGDIIVIGLIISDQYCFHFYLLSLI